MKGSILIVTPFMDTGGAEKVVCSLTEGFVDRGFEVTVASQPGRLTGVLEGYGANHAAVGELGIKRPVAQIVSASKLRKIIRQAKPELINVHAFSLLPTVKLALVGLRKKPPVVFTLHIPEKDSYFRVMGKSLGFLADAVICVCKWNRDRLIEEGVKPEQIFVGYNGVDFEHFKVDDRSELKGRKLRVGAVARLVARKGHATLFRALARLRAEHQEIIEAVSIYGDGPECESLKDLVKKLSLEDQVTFYGDFDDVRMAYRNIDVMVLASRSEGLPLTVLEAMCAGVLVSATPVNGVPEVVRDRETGRLFGVGDVDALVRVLIELYKDPAMTQRITQNALKMVQGEFGIHTMIDEYAKIFASVARAKS